MRILATFTFLSVFFPSDLNKYDDLFDKMGYAQSRCCNTGCVAMVSPGKKERSVEVINKYKTLEIFFNENSHILSSEMRDAIEQYTQQKKNVDLTFVGYTDECGTYQQNKMLALRRAEAVKAVYININPDADITIKATGEIAAGHNASSRKVHVTEATNIRFLEPMPKIVADTYLLDTSGSISTSDLELIRRSINYYRPQNSKIYISTTKCVRHMTPFSSISSLGGTEIWYSYWYILDYMKQGQTLAIISDFDSEVPLTSRERIRINEKATKKGVKVIAISL